MLQELRFAIYLWDPSLFQKEIVWYTNWKIDEEHTEKLLKLNWLPVWNSSYPAHTK